MISSTSLPFQFFLFVGSNLINLIRFEKRTTINEEALIATLEKKGGIMNPADVKAPAAMGITSILYAKAQQRFTIMNNLVILLKLNKETIFQRFSLSAMTSEAIILSSDLEFIETPTVASCILRTSLIPSPIIITSLCSLSFNFFNNVFFD